MLGRALSGEHRHKALIATKCGLDFSRSDGVYRNSTRTVILREVEDSLRRLNTDVIDLYQVHWPDPVVPFAETGAIFQDLKKQGKIRAIGVSNFSPAQMEAFRKAGPIHTSQPPYNLFERGAQQDVLPYCHQNHIATMVYGPLCRGLLSGRMQMDTKFEANDIRLEDPKFEASRYSHYLRAVTSLDEFAQKNFSKRVIDLALRWLLDQPHVSIVLWGGRKPTQLAPLQTAWNWTLGNTQTEIDRILTECIPQPIGPEFLTPKIRNVAAD